MNHSVRTWVDPKVLAEIASDNIVQSIDIPRQLVSEVAYVGTAMGFPEFRDKSGLTGKTVVIAIIDTEIASAHPAFQDRLIPKHNYSREAWGSANAHGTAVAGIVGARSADFLGIAPEATMYNYKVLASNRFLNGDDFDDWHFSRHWRMESTLRTAPGAPEPNQMERHGRL